MQPSTRLPPRSTIVIGAPLPAPRVAERVEGWKRVLRDVVGVRNIGMEPISPQRIRSLASRFDECAAANGSRRRSKRHRVETDVKICMLVREGVTTVAARMLDASATGAKLQTTERLPVGGLCWVLVGTGETATSGITFATRVMWTDPEMRLVGVAFVGRAVAGPHALL